MNLTPLGGQGRRGSVVALASSILWLTMLLPSGCLAERQVLQFRERQSGKNVVLVGTMHYNPVSIKKAENVVKKLGEENSLSSVVIEMCDKRWKSMESKQPRYSPRRKLLDNEMQGAADVARDNNVEVILGDEKISNIVGGAKNMMKKTALDILSPLKGWPEITADFYKFFSNKSGKGVPSLSVLDLLDPVLLLGLPITFVRYPAAFFLKNPLFALGLVGLFNFLSLDVGNTGGASIASIGGGEAQLAAQIAMQLNSALTALFLVFNFAVYLILARTILVVLLQERDEVLAGSIREACLNAKDEQTVVAVLGMAHCNGVAKLLAGEEGDMRTNEGTMTP
mmetsp:Transcript_24689/g.34325  ORF Transcript_24689/g.34325 Transcript_24689/m.34325 type:complete len:339 (+) Transcript_24689:91-1107(+)